MHDRNVPGMASYAIYEDLWPRRPNSQDIAVQLVTDFEPQDLVQSLAKISVFMHDDFYNPPGEKEKFLLRILLTPVELRKVELIFQTKLRQKVITRQTVLAAMQTALRHAEEKKPRHLVQEHTQKLGEALLRLNTFLEHDWELRKHAERSSQDLVLRAMALRNLMFNHGTDFSALIARYWAIIKYGMQAVEREYPSQHYDLERAFENLYGISIGQMYGMVLGIWGHYANKPLESLFKDPREFLLGENYFRNINPDLKARLASFFQYLALDLPTLCEKTRKALLGSPDNYHNFQSFWDHPMVELRTGVYFPLDIEFLQARATHGIYWTVFNRLLEEGNTRDLQRLRESFGHAFEWYINQQLQQAFSNGPEKSLWLEWDKEVEGVDVLLKEGETLFLIEITTSGLTYSTRVSCDPIRIEQELRKVWFGEGRKSAKLFQLFEAYQEAQRGDLEIQNFDFSHIKRTVPIIVFLQDLPQHKGLWQWYKRLMIDNGITEEFVNDLIVLEPAEIEGLCAFKQNGQIWSDLFAKWKASEYAGFSFRNYIHFSGQNFPKNKLIGEWFREASEIAKNALF